MVDFVYMSTKTITDSYMYVSSNGQLVIDKHPSDEAHLLSGPTSDVQPLHDCRIIQRVVY